MFWVIFFLKKNKPTNIELHKAHETLKTSKSSRIGDPKNPEGLEIFIRNIFRQQSFRGISKQTKNS